MRRLFGSLALLAAILTSTPAKAALAELDLMIVPQKQPRWVYGSGTMQISAWSSGYTSWGAMSYAVDLQFDADFEANPTMVNVEFEPVASIPKLLGMAIPEGYALTDAGLALQLKNGFLNDRYQPVPLSVALGPSIEFGGTWINGLRLDLMWRYTMPYEETYAVPYMDVYGVAVQTEYNDSWPIEPGIALGMSWHHTWPAGPLELFTRGFADVWQQAFMPVEQWSDDRPDEVYSGPTWAQNNASWRALTQPQIGVRFGKTLAYAIALEIEMAHNIYFVPEDDLSVCVDPVATSEGIYCLRREGFTAQAGLLLGLRF